MRQYTVPICYRGEALSIAVYEWGLPTAPMIFCVHGFFEQAYSFYAVAEHLSSRYRIVAIDLPGRGRSSAQRQHPYHFMGYVACIRACWAQLNCQEPMVLLGTSLGGLLSYVLAARYPQYCRAIILNDAPPQASWRVLSTFRPRLKRGMDLLKGCCGVGPRPYVLRPEVRAYQRRYDAWRQAQGPWFDYRLLSVLKQVFSVKKTPIVLWSYFKRLSVPILLLYAELSWLMSDAVVDQMLCLQPARLRAVHVPGALHPLGLCTPEEWSEIEAFLETCPQVLAGKVVLTPGFVEDDGHTVG